MNRTDRMNGASGHPAGARPVANAQRALRILPVPLLWVSLLWASLLWIALLCAAMPAAHAATASAATVQSIRQLLADFPASYDVSHNGFHLGVAQRTLRQTAPDTLVFESVARPTGLAALFVSDHIIERSDIRVAGRRLLPQQYSYRKTGGKHERSYTLQFNWPQKQIHSSYEDKTLPLLPEPQDLLSFQLALMLDLQQGKHDFSYAIADKKRIREYRFQVAGEEQLNTAIGRLRTVKLVHEDHDGEGRFVFWLAKQRGYLPVRIQRHDEDGDMTEMTLRSLQGTNLRLPGEDALN